MINSTNVGQRLRAPRAFMSTAAALFSVVAAPAFADLLPPKVITSTPGGINVGDGSFLYSVTDLSIGTLSLERFQITGPKAGVSRPAKPHLGLSMTDNFDIYVASNFHAATRPPNPKPERYLPIVHLGSSASGVYALSGSTVSPWNVDAYSGTLVLSNGNYVYTDKDGTVYTFSSAISAGLNSPSQRVVRIDYADGRSRNFSYTGSSQLKRVSDSSGYAIVFDYDGSGNVSAACGFNTAHSFVSDATSCSGATLKVTYNHDGSGSLTSVIDAMNQTTSYTETGWGITCIQPPGYSSCKISNDYQTFNGATTNVVQTLADGEVWNVATGSPDIADDPDHVPNNDCGDYGGFTDPNAKSTSIRFTNTSPCSVTDADGNVTHYIFIGGSQFDYTGPLYHDGALMTEADMPEGNKYLALYSGPFNSVSKQTWKAKPNSGIADQVVTYGYDFNQTPQSMAKPISKLDANGNETDWLYTSFGMPYWEMQPAPTSGTARPLKLFTYLQKNAWVLDGNGNLVTSGNQIWLPASETQCQTAAGSSSAVCDASAPQMVTTYEYGADGTVDNLLLRGKVVSADGQSLRTCYQYDWQGNKIAETSPRAGLSSCPA